ncbi:SPOR domain-containing protein [Palleronia abyssalis]|uniref:SPOR domain-containing protein n=1 Tax=Palleronia abyssalis TaxID=1501240 RepID=A0A2R8BX71_9RHOB|nr:SPOR domain-containing protein [Palleronia abyssalis]SPJ24723.1 hypothetical protein PAA8504_02561 [Palleronia abyssalis]
MLKPAALGLALLLSSFTPATAQVARVDLADAPPPAEFPPNSFSGRQYVDSRGCVYVRGGEGATSIWVPRVTSGRKVLCGFKPTLTATANTQAPVVPDRAPAVRTAGLAPAQTRPAAPVAVAPTAAAPRTAPQAGRYVPPRVTYSYSPSPYTGRTPRPVAQVPRTWPVAPSIPPRTVPAGEAGGRILAGDLPPGSVIGIPPSDQPQIPPGYRRAWEDGRLNPYAGKQTLTGALQQALVWTQTVPRRLKTADGRDVTSQYNYLVYPFTDYDKQRAALGSGRYVTVQTTAGSAVVPAPQAQRSVSISTKSTPTGGRYVQVASFGDAGNAQRTAQRLSAAGLPAAISRQGGLQVVLAGPFPRDRLAGALGRVRGAGFADAFVR